MAGWLSRLTGRGRVDPAAYPAGPVRDLAAALPRDLSVPVLEADLLALDLETTGMDLRSDHVLSAGWVPVSGGQVVLGGAREVLVRPPDGVEVGESATLHGLTDDLVATAPRMEEVLPEVLAALQGRVLVAHFARIETRFLSRAAVAVHGCRLPMVALDTLTIQQGLVSDEHGEVRQGALRLAGARQHFGLPRYAAHSAVTDALGTAELLLAQAAEIAHRKGRAATLGDLSPSRFR